MVARLFSLGFPLLLAASLAAPALAADPLAASRSPASIPLSTDEITRQLKAAVEEAQLRLGALEPWQKKVFDEEAVPQYQRFIRDYRTSQGRGATASNALAVDLDFEALQAYLRFHGSRSLGRADREAPILLYLRAAESCEKCVAAGPALRKLVGARVANRGFKPVWITADDLGASQALEGTALDEKVEQLADTRDAAASLVIQWGPAPIDDIDTAHADENKYLIRSVMRTRGLVSPALARAAAGSAVSGRTDGRMEILENDSFETASSRLLTDAFVDLGGQAIRAETLAKSSRPLDVDQPEIELDVLGVQDFAQLGRVKAQVQGKLVGISVEERKISRGRVVFAVVGASSVDALRTELTNLRLEPGRLALAGARAPASIPAEEDSGGVETLRMEIVP